MVLQTIMRRKRYTSVFFFIIIIILRKTKNEGKRVVFPNALCGQDSLMYLEASDKKELRYIIYLNMIF